MLAYYVNGELEHETESNMMYDIDRIEAENPGKLIEVYRDGHKIWVVREDGSNAIPFFGM